MNYVTDDKKEGDRKVKTSEKQHDVAEKQHDVACGEGRVSLSKSATSSSEQLMNEPYIYYYSQYPALISS